MRVQLLISSLVIGAAGLLSGCGQPPPATFVLNEKATGDLIPEARQLVQNALDDNFGTPNQLVAWEKFSAIDFGAPQPGAADKERHVAGWRLHKGRNLYMQHCQHCHGVSGDGNGPTARFLNPRPRDYRQGVFKFKSTKPALKPARTDLVHILEQGIPGTYMPSFVLLGEENLGLIVDYVRWLSIRGQMEIRLASDFAAAGATPKDIESSVENAVQAAKEEKKKPNKTQIKNDTTEEVLKGINEELAATIESAATDIAEAWTTAEEPDNVVKPKVKRTPPTKESIARGKQLFLSQVKGKETKCVDCHGPAGRGDGPNTELFWAIPGTTPERKYEAVGLHDVWGQPQKPRDLTRGVYRGGRRPIDLYRRFYGGIPGTQMPEFGGTVLKTDEEVWDLVNYVLSIPFDGKESPYPAEAGEEPKAEVATVGK